MKRDRKSLTSRPKPIQRQHAVLEEEKHRAIKVRERNRMGEALRPQTELMRAVFNSAQAAIFILDAQNPPRIQDCNEAASSIFGYQKPEMLGKTTAFLHVDDGSLREFQSLLYSAMNEELPFELQEFVMKRKDGSIFPSEHSVSQLRNDKGERIGSVSVVRDITERRRMEDEIKRYSEHLEELVEQRTRGLAESESRFRTLLENLPVKIFTKNRESVYVSCNDNFARDVNMKADEIAGKTDYDFYPKDIADSYRAFDRKIVQSGKTDEMEERYLANGREFWVRTIKTPLRDAGGNITGLLGIFLDITERKQVEDRVKEGIMSLQENEAKFRGLYDSIRDGIVYNDLAGRIYDCNRAFENMVGYSLDELRKIRYQDITPEQYREIEERITREEMVKGGFSGYVEKEFIRKDGARVAVEVAASVVKGTERKPDMIWAVIRDITERKLMEERLLRSERWAAVGETAAMVAHDLRNPLQGITGAVQLLKQEAMTTKERDEMLQLIQNSVEYLDEIVSELSEFSGEIHPQLGMTTTKSIIRDAINAVKIPEKIKLQDSLEEDSAIIIDKAKTRRVLINLLENAIDAMPQGGTLTISSKRSNCTVEIAFSDTGPGMSQEVLENLWKPLQTTKAKGLGLGLAICKRIVEAHRGNISVKSRIGEGTTVTILLPINPNLVEVKQK